MNKMKYQEKMKQRKIIFQKIRRMGIWRYQMREMRNPKHKKMRLVFLKKKNQPHEINQYDIDIFFIINHKKYSG
jgi:hypothetical protein